MKSKLAKVITVSCLVLVVSLFLVSLFSRYKNNNDMVYVIKNNNLNKMDENTLLLFKNKVEEKNTESEENVTESVVEDLNGNKEEEKKEETKEVIEETKVEEPQKEEKEVPVVVTTLSEDREVLQTVVGNLTGYGPDCVGCGGLTSTGHNLYDSIYYEDSEFGTVRILAADPSFPFYSIVRVSNVPSMEDFIGIVLDRGGNVGFGRGTLFDLAFESESSPNLIPLTHNVTFELLRSGR